jgi:hypothetical protein
MYFLVVRAQLHTLRSIAMAGNYSGTLESAMPLMRQVDTKMVVTSIDTSRNLELLVYWNQEET